MPRPGWWMAGLATALLLGFAASHAFADPATTTATDSTTATTTSPTTTSSGVTSTATTSTAMTATTSSTTTSTTAATKTTTSVTRSAAEAAASTSRWFGRGCPVAAVALLLPRREPLLLGPVESAPITVAGLSRMVYPAGGSMVIASGVDLGEAACTSRGPSDAHAELRSLSLFGGAVTAAQVRLTIGPDASSVDGLAVEGKPASPRARRRLPVKTWGYVTIGSGRPLLTNVDGHAVSPLAVHLLERHDGLPAGTVVLVSVAGLPANAATRWAAEHHRRVASHEPLKVTPPLGQRHFIFPVAGPSDYIDTYGAFRSDVPGNWHHGDDIFAPLGTPVVAVASGTINRVGWEHVGGWRLWVRDEAGDEFYYAHLSGYAPTDLHSDRVRAGEVIGFIGNTGDAFSTSPHLHFEVHPRQLLHLGYDGAVDPTRYLNRWTHLKRVTVPTPTHPPFPSQPALRQEAGYVWRELLAARHLTRHAPPPSARPHIHIPIGANGRPIAAALPPIAVTVRHESSLTTTEVAVLAALVSLAVFAATILGPGRLRRLGLLRTVGRHDPDKDE